MFLTKVILILSSILLPLIFLKVFNLGGFLSWILPVMIIGIGYIIYSNIRQRKRCDLVEQDLDPEAFIEATKKQIRITGKNKQAYAILNHDLIVGLLSMRKYEEARNILDEINEQHLPKWNGSILSYYSIEMVLYSNAGDIDRAHEVYETKIRNYPIKILSESMTMDLILADKSLREKEYTISRELFNKVLKYTKSKRLKLEIYYSLAIIDEEEGKIEEAIKKYKKVADKGNKLHSSLLAKEKLKELENLKEQKGEIK